MKAFTPKTLLNCGFSQSFCISLMKKVVPLSFWPYYPFL